MFADTHTGPPSSYNREHAANKPAAGTVTGDQRDTRDPATLGRLLLDRPQQASLTDWADTLAALFSQHTPKPLPLRWYADTLQAEGFTQDSTNTPAS